MPRPTPLPPELAAQPFAVELALRAGVGRGRLRSPDLERPFYGVRSAPGLTPLAAYAPRLRLGDRFSHTTAAELWGAPVPARLAGVIHVTAGPGLDGPRGRGVIGHESADSACDVRNGHPVSTPIATFLESANLLTVDELVALGDYLVLDPRVAEPGLHRPLSTVAGIRAAARDARGRGVRTARAAAAAVRSGVESPRETELRLLLMRAGLPEPICGYELRNGSTRIGWFDLAWPAKRVLAEYDGDQHRTSTRQYDRDIQRFDLAADIGWRVIRVRARGLLTHPDTTVARVSRALGIAPSGRNGR